MLQVLTCGFIKVSSQPPSRLSLSSLGSWDESKHTQQVGMDGRMVGWLQTDGSNFQLLVSDDVIPEAQENKDQCYKLLQ